MLLALGIFVASFFQHGLHAWFYRPGLQILALHYGSLTLVQPLLVLSLLFAVLLAGFGIRRQPPDAVLLAGVTCCAAGIAGFLAVARPHGGAGTAGPATTATSSSRASNGSAPVRSSSS